MKQNPLIKYLRERALMKRASNNSASSSSSKKLLTKKGKESSGVTKSLKVSFDDSIVF